jgi:hypothetical protein
MVSVYATGLAKDAQWRLKRTLRGAATRSRLNKLPRSARLAHVEHMTDQPQWVLS